MMTNLSSHADHTWSQHGRCVYCDDCDIRLYQGKLPARGDQKANAKSIDDILDATREKIIAKDKKEWEERSLDQEAAFEAGKASYVPGESIMDRMRRGNPHKGTNLAVWYNRGWQNAEGEYFSSKERS